MEQRIMDKEYFVKRCWRIDKKRKNKKLANKKD